MTAEALTYRDDPLPPPVELPKMQLARLLCTRAEAIVFSWRRAYCGQMQDPLETTGQLDGLIEPLLVEMGYSLGEPGDLPAAPWGRACGVLRLSLSRGANGLAQEFALLRGLLEQAADQLGASAPERKRLRILLDAAQAQAQALLRHRIGPNVSRPAVAFGGVVVEVA
jgi:hypothetical protein